MKHIPVYIGTYTTGDSQGIYRLILDTEQKKMKAVSIAATIDNPTYLALSKNKKYLYSVAKVNGKGGVAAFSINEETGLLTLLNTVVADGANPCHISIDSLNTLLFSANYHKGLAEAYSLQEDGSINKLSSVVKHEGKGVHKERQDKPYVHYAGPTPDEKYLCVVDLGTDALVTYEVQNGISQQKHTFSTKPGSGPRHLVFHPNGYIAYLFTELTAEIIVLRYHQEDGRFTEVETIPTLPEDFTGENTGGAIRMSPNGSYLYVSNRGHDSIATFNINQDSGKLTFVSHTNVEGKHPRDFEIDPTGQFLIAANKDTNNLVLFEINELTGELIKTNESLTIPEPVCVVFLD